MLGNDFLREKEKLKEINIIWEHDDDIRVFLQNFQKLKDQLDEEYGIDWADDMHMMHAVSELCDSKLFTEEEMMDWEDKCGGEQMYTAIVAYFTNAYGKHERFGSIRSPTTQGYGSANNVTEQTNNVSDQ